MGAVAQGNKGDDVLARELDGAPQIIRECGEDLEAVAYTLPASALLDAAVRLYECLVERAIGGRDRDAYAMAGAYCRVIRSIRRLQKREVDFDRHYGGIVRVLPPLSGAEGRVAQGGGGAGIQTQGVNV